MRLCKIRPVALCLAALLCLGFAAGCRSSQEDGSSPSGAGKVRMPSPKEDLTVIIDAGHGFRDPGSQPSFMLTPEKDATLKAAFILRDALEAKGVRVVLTHDGETYPSEETIIEKADEYGVKYNPAEKATNSNHMIDDGIFSAYERMIWSGVLEKQYPDAFFISLHTNSLDESQPGASEVSGSSVYWCGDSNSRDDCVYFADRLGDIMDGLGIKLRTYETPYDDSFFVTKNVAMPAVLIELGFGSNESDAEKIQSEAWLSDFAAKVASLLAETYLRSPVSSGSWINRIS